MLDRIESEMKARRPIIMQLLRRIKSAPTETRIYIHSCHNLTSLAEHRNAMGTDGTLVSRVQYRFANSVVDS